MPKKNRLTVKFEVSTNFNMSIDEATAELLKCETLLNSASKLRWYIVDVTLNDLKTFILNQQNNPHDTETTNELD